ncbi:AUGMIN subunit 6-like [Typha latifolia]|uniref:AUGMIN subunit 6-like n=1 Tax=Typha latifolia TaxID=4733 RepID=UPI003C2E7E56
MATEREKEREAELESAMYTNCLLLGLDPAILEIGGAGGGGGRPRVGQFRHSNPRLGEQLLYFLLSSLRGPVQSSKDFDKVWPIFDSAQSRDFRKIVQGIISELESQGALPRSNSRVSSLATCCGPRFVELLWQLSVHALREVHKRTFAADVASNPLPASLTDVSYLHAAALLPVTKARIALERRKFLKNANNAVHKQTTWSNLAQEMTSEFRGLCAEEAYLHQQLEKLQGMRNKAKLEGELWDDHISSTSGQKTHMVSKATCLWESLLARKSQHELLASGPIEDLIAHREHRYRISGSSLLAAMDLSSSVPYSEVLSVRAGELSPAMDHQDQMDAFQHQATNESLSRVDDKGGRVHSTVDVAEVIRRWTHALQRIHRQSLHLAKANDGEGPELLRSAADSNGNGHAESLTTTLAEHRQHLASVQGLIDQLKEAVPAMQKSISELTDEVNSISSSTMDAHLPIQSPNAAGPIESCSDEVVEMTSKLSSVYVEKVAVSPSLKLPHLFSITPNLSGKGMHATKQHAVSIQTNQENVTARKSITQSSVNVPLMSHPQDSDSNYAQDIKRSVRDAALSRPPSNSELLLQKTSDDGSEHFFIPLSTVASGKEEDAMPNRRKQRLIFSPPEIAAQKSTKDYPFSTDSQLNTVPTVSTKLNGLDEYGDPRRFFQSSNNNAQWASLDADAAIDQVFSPPLLMESSLFQDTYEDLLAPLSETDAALMEY